MSSSDASSRARTTIDVPAFRAGASGLAVKVADLGWKDNVCLEESPPECSLASHFGDSYSCKCALPVYIWNADLTDCNGFLYFSPGLPITLLLFILCDAIQMLVSPQVEFVVHNYGRSGDRFVDFI